MQPTGELLLEYTKALAWPVVAGVAMWRYRDVVASLLPGSKITLKVLGQSIEKTIPEMKSLVAEILTDGSPTEAQRALLWELYANGGWMKLEKSKEGDWRSLRNAGLVRSHPTERQLADADSIAITPIGKLALEAIDK